MIGNFRQEHADYHSRTHSFLIDTGTVIGRFTMARSD